MNYLQVIDAGYRDDAVETLQKFSKGLINTVQFVRRYIRKDSTEFWASFSGHLIKDAIGNPLHIIGVLTDIDKLKKQEIEIQKKNEKLSIQKAKIETAHNHITDSINYASRIQTAAMPSPKLRQEILPEHFVLFKPRDIVSGDYFWMQNIKHYLLVAAVDCTGHGVPGALLSMLGISFLNDIVRQAEITQANQVLEEMRKRIKATLGQAGDKSGSQDGMDMAFYIIDLNTNVIQFSGAQNPLYLYREGELSEYKADRQPIAIYPREQPFTNHEFQLQKGDALYTFSDGFVDQFGGDKGKKYMSKRFKQTLGEIQDRTMPEQKTILEQTFDNWRGDRKQIDDVLVIGLKI